MKKSFPRVKRERGIKNHHRFLRGSGLLLLLAYVLLLLLLLAYNFPLRGLFEYKCMKKKSTPIHDFWVN